MRLSDAGLRRRQTKLIYPNHRFPPWLTEDTTPEIVRTDCWALEAPESDANDAVRRSSLSQSKRRLGQKPKHNLKKAPNKYHEQNPHP